MDNVVVVVVIVSIGPKFLKSLRSSGFWKIILKILIRYYFLCCNEVTFLLINILYLVVCLLVLLLVRTVSSYRLQIEVGEGVETDTVSMIVINCEMCPFSITPFLEIYSKLLVKCHSRFFYWGRTLKEIFKYIFCLQHYQWDIF